MVAKVITLLWKKYNMNWEFWNRIVKPVNLIGVVVPVLISGLRNLVSSGKE